MAKTPRPPKARGNRNYHDEVLAGKPDILDTELDADFNQIYDTVNGKLIDENIQAAAAIDYSKLNLAGRIKFSDLASGFAFPGGQLTADSITTRELAPNAVILENIAPTQSVQSLVTSGDDTDFVLSTAEQDLCQQPWTTRGGRFFVIGTCGGFFVATTTPIDVTIRLRDVNSASVLHAARITADSSAVGAAVTMPWSVTVIASGVHLLDVPFVPAQKINMTGQITLGPGSAIVRCHWKRLMLIELA